MRQSQQGFAIAAAAEMRSDSQEGDIEIVFSQIFAQEGEYIAQQEAQKQQAQRLQTGVAQI